MHLHDTLRPSLVDQHGTADFPLDAPDVSGLLRQSAFFSVRVGRQTLKKFQGAECGDARWETTRDDDGDVGESLCILYLSNSVSLLSRFLGFDAFTIRSQTHRDDGAASREEQDLRRGRGDED